MLRGDLLARLQTPRFWTDYLHFTDPEWPAASSLRWDVPLDLGAAVGLELAIDYGTAGATLLIRDFGEDTVPVEVAWDDQAHWHPHVFRWPEIDAVCHRIASRNADYPHPGTPLLLLYRFAPLCSEPEYQRYHPLLEAAWRKLGLFTSDEIESFIDRVDFRNQGVQWRHNDTLGWTVEQVDPRAEREVYSLRVPGNTEFPFKRWNSLMSDLSAGAADA